MVVYLTDIGDRDAVYRGMRRWLSGIWWRWTSPP
jgi:hypothetical protein